MAKLGEESLTEKVEVRFTKQDLELLDRVAKAWRCSRPDVIRKAVGETLDAEQKKKILGVNGEVK